MDNIYTKHDMAEAIAKVEELARVNAELDELLYRGSNDEKLVEKKIELQNSVRKFKSADLGKTIEGDGFKQSDSEKENIEELTSLKEDYQWVITRYKARKLRLEAEISMYKNGS